MKIFNWKQVAMILALLVLYSSLSNFLNYYRTRFLFASPLIPEFVFARIAQPYLISAAVLGGCSLLTGALIYFKKYQLSVVVSVIAFVFDFVNLEIIGESWAGSLH